MNKIHCVILLMFSISAISDATALSWDCSPDEAPNTCFATLDSNGVFIVSGSGMMKDYASTNGHGYTSAPWNDNLQQISSVVIEDGITTISDRAFRGAENLTDIKISDTVTSIGAYAFDECVSLSNVILPDSVISLKKSAFENSGLTSITLSDKTQMGSEAFWNLHSSGLTINCRGSTDICKKNFTNDNGTSLINFKHAKRRIYTLKEALEAAGKINTVKIKYR